MSSRFFLFILILTFPMQLLAQELNCTVNVLTPRIQSSDKRIYTTLQTTLYEFMNNTRWTGDKYQSDEKIECSIQIEISERISTDEFKGSIQITSRRPVYGTSYNSPILNYKDDDFTFRYIEYQSLEFSESGTNSNLVFVMAYWAYVVIGFDYDTYSPMGGNTWFSKAQNIVANNANSPYSGWTAFSDNKQRNRYWLSEAIGNPIYRPIRQFNYAFHRQGLDMMTKKTDESIRIMAQSVNSLKAVHQQRPLSLLMNTIFDAKADEMVNLFSGATPDIKADMVETLSMIDAPNTTKWEKITSSGN